MHIYSNFAIFFFFFLPVLWLEYFDFAFPFFRLSRFSSVCLSVCFILLGRFVYEMFSV